MYENLNDVIHKIIDKISEKTPVDIVGASEQSCSMYLKIKDITVRISDHNSTYNQLSTADYSLGLDVDSKLVDFDDFIKIKKVYEKSITTFDGDGEELSTIRAECEEHDDDAEHVGYRMTTKELNRVVDNILFEVQFSEKL